MQHATVQTVKTFLQPAVAAGVLSRDELRAVILALQRGPASTQTAATGAEHRAGLLRTGEAARLLAVHPKTLSRLKKAGALQAVYLRPGVAKSLRYRRGDVIALCERGAAQ